jgi:hypothetical protein
LVVWFRRGRGGGGIHSHFFISLRSLQRASTHLLHQRSATQPVATHLSRHLAYPCCKACLPASQDSEKATMAILCSTSSEMRTRLSCACLPSRSLQCVSWDSQQQLLMNIAACLSHLSRLHRVSRSRPAKRRAQRRAQVNRSLLVRVEARHRARLAVSRRRSVSIRVSRRHGVSLGLQVRA